MKTVRVVMLGAVVLWALPLWAFLPPDAQFRKNEIVQQRVRARAEYAQQQEDYAKDIVASRIRARIAMQKPPWMRVDGNKTQSMVGPGTVLADMRSSQINHRFLTSVVLLISIGVAAGWVWYKTREIDE
jgi:hypothetical protein